MTSMYAEIEDNKHTFRLHHRDCDRLFFLYKSLPIDYFLKLVYNT